MNNSQAVFGIAAMLLQVSAFGPGDRRATC